jgi:putative transposase
VPLRLSRAVRVVLAALARLLAGSQLRRLRLIILPGILFRWHAGLVRCRWACPRRARGRPGTARAVRWLVLELACGSPGWGCRRIRGELAGLGCELAPSSVWQILQDAGAGSAPGRSARSWRAFPGTRAKAILAAGFFRVGAVFLRCL